MTDVSRDVMTVRLWTSGQCALCCCAGPVLAALDIPADLERLILLTDNTRKWVAAAAESWRWIALAGRQGAGQCAMPCAALVCGMLFSTASAGRAAASFRLLRSYVQRAAVLEASTAGIISAKVPAAHAALHRASADACHRMPAGASCSRQPLTPATQR